MKRLFTFLLLLNFSSLAQNVDLKKGLIADFPIFHGKTFDISGNSNHGIIEGTPTFVSDRFGNPNGAIRFNGISDAFSIKNSSSINSLNKTNAFAISAWIYIEDFGPKGLFPILSKSANFSKNGALFAIDSSGFVFFNNSVADFTYSGMEIKLKEWHHVVINYQLTNEGELELGFYLDEIGGQNPPEDREKPTSSAIDLYLGKGKRMNGKIVEVIWANALMDNIKIYNRILNTNEVKALFELDDNTLGLQNLFPIPTMDSLMLVNKTRLDAINEMKGKMMELPMDREPIKDNILTNRGIIETESSNSELEKPGKYYALIIGNNDYQDSLIVDLDNPINDAKNLLNVLISNYNFELPDVKLLENGTYEQIIEALDYFKNTVRPEDSFLIFYAGHGHWDKKQGYWLPIDAKKKNTANYIRNSTIKDYMSYIESKHTLLITDACFGGGIFKSRAAFADAEKSVNNLYDLKSRKAMTSGGVAPVADESIFLRLLVSRLKDNKLDYLPSNKLYSSFNESVMNNSKSTPQYGVIQECGDDGGEFIFIKRK